LHDGDLFPREPVGVDGRERIEGGRSLRFILARLHFAALISSHRVRKKFFS